MNVSRVAQMSFDRVLQGMSKIGSVYRTLPFCRDNFSFLLLKDFTIRTGQCETERLERILEQLVGTTVMLHECQEAPLMENEFKLS